MVRSPCKAVLWIACSPILVHAGVGQAQEGIARMGPSPYLIHGAHALSMGDYYEAIQHTQRGLDEPIEPTHRSAALSNLCAGFDAIGEYRHALEACDAALAIDDRNWQAYVNRAIARLRLGLLVAARTDLDHGLALNPASSDLLAVHRLVQQSEASSQSSPQPRTGSGKEPSPD